MRKIRYMANGYEQFLKRKKWALRVWQWSIASAVAIMIAVPNNPGFAVQSLLLISGLSGAVYLFKPTGDVPAPIPGERVKAFKLSSNHRLGRQAFTVFQWLLFTAPAWFVVAEWRPLPWGGAAAVLLPASAWAVAKWLGIVQAWKFRMEVSESALRLTIDEPLDFLFSELAHVRRDRSLWLLTARDGRSEWVDEAWAGAQAEAFRAALLDGLTHAKVRIDESAEKSIG